MEEKFDRIVDFAELWDYIDQPLRTYSSGMFMRLGFSVAIHSDPDIVRGKGSEQPTGRTEQAIG